MISKSNPNIRLPLKSRGEELFSSPLPVPSETIYSEVSVEPDASEHDIRRAVEAFNSGQESEKKVHVDALKLVYDQVPDLEDAYSRLDAVRNKGKNAGADELRAALSRVADLEKKALSFDRRFLEHREKKAVIERRILELNNLGLDDTEKRLAYDRAHPPLALLKLVSCTTDNFLADRRTAMKLLRAELARFLSDQGETVLHPSDLTREDFTGDFTYHPILDGPEHE